MQLLLRFVKNFVFRFFLIYWVCFIFPFPFDLVGLPFQLVETKHQPEWMKEAAKVYGQGFMWVTNQKNDAIKWVAREVFDKSVVIQPTGSGDTLRNYVGCFCAAVIALGGAFLWSLVEWKGRGHATLHAIVRVLVRYFLIRMLLGYGFAKVFPLQFPEPTYRLTQVFGDLSPMGLLWAFMGFSAPYQIFTGAVEVLAGVLLLTRRTTLLGALLTVIAMTQIFALNMCFDVPVKLYSFHYLVMGLYLTLPDVPRLFKVLVLHQAVEATPIRPLLNNVWVDRFGILFRTLLIAAWLWTNISSSYNRFWEIHGGPASPVEGRWDTVSLQIDGKDAEKDHPLNWKSWDFSFKGSVRLYGPQLPALAYKITWKPEEKRLTLGKFSNPLWYANFQYELPEADQLLLTGEFDDKKIVARFKQAPLKKYELTNRGFHWIQEMPYNR